MNEKYIIKLSFGKCFTVKFESICDENREKQRVSYLRINDLGIVDAEKGLLAIDFAKKKAIFHYDTIEITSDLFLSKVAEGNIYFRCKTDLCFFDVYIIKAEDVVRKDLDSLVQGFVDE